MKRMQKGRKKDLLSPSLEPVQHLSCRFQRKLIKRANKNVGILEALASRTHLPVCGVHI